MSWGGSQQQMSQSNGSFFRDAQERGRTEAFQTEATQMVRRMLESLKPRLTWMVALPAAPKSPLLYLPEEIESMYDFNGGSRHAAEPDIDAMGCNVLEEVDMVYFALRPWELMEMRNHVEAMNHRKEEMVARNYAEGSTIQTLPDPLEDNPLMEREDFELIDVDFHDTPLHQRDKPSLALMQNPIYTEIGLEHPEARAERRKQRHLDHLASQQSITDQLASGSSSPTFRGGGCKPPEERFAEGVRHSFKFVAALDVSYSALLTSVAKQVLFVNLESLSSSQRPELEQLVSKLSRRVVRLLSMSAPGLGQILAEADEEDDSEEDHQQVIHAKVEAYFRSMDRQADAGYFVLLAMAKHALSLAEHTTVIVQDSVSDVMTMLSGVYPSESLVIELERVLSLYSQVQEAVSSDSIGNCSSTAEVARTMARAFIRCGALFSKQGRSFSKNDSVRLVHPRPGRRFPIEVLPVTPLHRDSSNMNSTMQPAAEPTGLSVVSIRGGRRGGDEMSNLGAAILVGDTLLRPTGDEDAPQSEFSAESTPFESTLEDNVHRAHYMLVWRDEDVAYMRAPRQVGFGRRLDALVPHRSSKSAQEIVTTLWQ